MTHDELLAIISLEDKQLVSYEEFEKRNSALRAVVELHKPTPENRYPEKLCQSCSMTEEGIYVYYPCSSIQAIEKELK